MAAVPSDRRYAGGRTCPICDGQEKDPRGQERRCFGFLSEDGVYAHCSREEHAGNIERSASLTYGHRLVGPCRCGRQHAAVVEKVKRREVATYDYRDEQGVLLYQVVRYEPKSFAQRRPPVEPGGKWQWKLEGVRRVLYRLDRVLEADPQEVVWIVEGEKDVHTLEGLGLVATCNPQGAGKWSHVEACAQGALAGRRCVVIADPNKPGRDHATDVKARLVGVAAGVKIIELPGEVDASDWVARGGTVELLQALAEAEEPPVAEAIASDFTRTPEGKIYHSQANIRLALAKLGVTLRHDCFGHRPEVDGLGCGPLLDQTSMNKIRLKVDDQWAFRVAKEFWSDVLLNEAWTNRYNPAVDHFASLKWDGVERIGSPRAAGWLSRYGGAPDTEYTRAVGRLWLIAAVRRARQPGCKFDEMLILESAGGKNKSQMFEILAIRKEWLCDDLPIGAETKELMEQTAGKLIVVCEELKGWNKAGADRLKSYISRTVDSARMAYRRDAEMIPRQFVLAGTTNPTGGYFRDHAGNRRYWPVAIKEFALGRFKEDIAQIWAEAAAAEAAGESIRLDPSLYAAAEAEQEQRMVSDSMEEMIADCFGELEGKVKVSDAWKCTGIYPDRPLNQQEMERFGLAMRRQGWLPPRQFMVNGERKTYYSRGNCSRVLRVEGSGGGATCTIK